MPDEGEGDINFDYTQSAAESFYFAEAFSTASSFFQSYSEDIYLAETLSLSVESISEDNIYLVESVTNAISKLFRPFAASGEVPTIVEIFSKVGSFVRSHAEDIYVSEVFTKTFYSPDPALPFAESVSLSESSSLSFFSTPEEEVYLSEDLTKIADFTRSHAEDLYLTEAFTIEGEFIQSYSEDLYLTEAFTKVSSSSSPEDIYLAEAFSKEADFVRSADEDVYLSENFNRYLASNFAEDLYLSEAMSMSADFIRPQADSVYLSESMSKVGSFTRAHAENLYLSEIFNISSSLVDAHEDLFLAESLSKVGSFTRAHAENAYLSEAFSYDLQAFLAFQEALYLSESFSVGMIRRMSVLDVFYVAENMTRKTLKTLNDNAYLSEVLSMVFHHYIPPIGEFDDFVFDENFTKEHYAETIRAIERPFVVQVKSVPILLSVKGYQEVSDHANPTTWLVRATDSVKVAEAETHVHTT